MASEAMAAPQSGHTAGAGAGVSNCALRSCLPGLFWPSAGSSLRRLHRVAEEHSDGGWSDASDAWRDSPRDFFAAFVDVGEELAAFVAHAPADDGGARRDVLRLQDAGHPRGGNHDLGP